MSLNIGEKLRQYRKKSNFSVKFVSSALSKNGFNNCSASAIYNWEQGLNYPNIEMFTFLCDMYGVESIDSILRNFKYRNNLESDSGFIFIKNNYNLLNSDGKDKILSYFENIVNCKSYRDKDMEELYITRFVAKGGEIGEIKFDEDTRNCILHDIKLLSKKKKKIL